MKKIFAALFLVILGSIGAYAQKDIGNDRENKDGNFGRCLGSRESIPAYKKCVEYEYLPHCPNGWERIWKLSEYTCRNIKTPRDTDRFLDRIPSGNEFRKAGMSERRSYRNLSNEQPESFEPN